LGGFPLLLLLSLLPLVAGASFRESLENRYRLCRIHICLLPGAAGCLLGIAQQGALATIWGLLVLQRSTGLGSAFATCAIAALSCSCCSAATPCSAARFFSRLFAMLLAIVAPMTGATDAADAATVDPIVPIALETPDKMGSGTPMAVLAVFARAAAALAPARNRQG
jgi:hypothetical protein